MIPADKISVVIPCFNAGRYIASTLQSVLSQDWPDLEVIVVDDGSSDDSAAVVRDGFPSVQLIRQANQGVAAARNLGISRSTGDWVAFLDADDIWLPGKLRQQRALLHAEPNARMAYSAWQVWMSEEAAPERPEEWLGDGEDPARWIGPSGWIYAQLLLDCEVWTSTVIARRSLFDEIGTFDASLRIGEDYDLWLRASRVTPILRVQRPLALYRQHAQSITRSAQAENYRGLVIARALGAWGYDDGHDGRADPARVHRALAKSWSDFAASNLQAGDLGRARQGALSSLRADPTYAAGWKTLVKTAFQALSPAGRTPS